MRQVTQACCPHQPSAPGGHRRQQRRLQQCTDVPSSCPDKGCAVVYSKFYNDGCLNKIQLQAAVMARHEALHMQCQRLLGVTPPPPPPPTKKPPPPPPPPPPMKCTTPLLDPAHGCAVCKEPLLSPSSHCTLCSQSLLLDPRQGCALCHNLLLDPRLLCGRCIDTSLDPRSGCARCLRGAGYDPQQKCERCKSRAPACSSRSPVWNSDGLVCV
jgi:hypothetical protein